MKFFTLFALLLSPAVVTAKSAFAHFMVGNTAGFSTDDWSAQMKLAQGASIDAFALNMANEEDTTRSSVPLAFDAAAAVGFKLFFSFDYAGNGAWDKQVVIDLITQYSASSAYFYRGSQAFVSTFEGPENAVDWIDIKSQTGCFFMPDWSSLGAQAAMLVEDGIADGLFNWQAWATGPYVTNTYPDASYIEFLGGKPYMAPISPWFYTNLPGYDKNWLWKGDNLWFDRWQQIIAGEFQPEYVEIISWNDYGESHYIGPLDDTQYAAFDTGEAPFNYVENMDHSGWRNFLPYIIELWKTGSSTVTQEGTVYWYRLNPIAACADGGTIGNTASQLLLEYPVTEMMDDAIFFSALLGSAADVSVSVGGVSLSAEWSTVPAGGVGLYHGTASTGGRTGAVVVAITRNGASISTTNGESITTTCPSGLNNFNAWVGYGWGNTISGVSPPVNTADQVCIKGFGVNNFAGLCEFTCGYGYCPMSACTCSQLGTQVEKPEATGDVGYPLPGASPAYNGLCSFAYNYGYYPAEACGSVDGGTTIPNSSPFLADFCTAGTGPSGYEGLCSYACNYGFCPMRICTCTGFGPLNLPTPAITDDLDYTTTDGSNDRGLCDWACRRGEYCPAPCKAAATVTVGVGTGYESGSGDTSTLTALLTVQADYIRIHANSDISDLANLILASDTCPVLAKAKRADIVDCITDSFNILIANTLYLDQVLTQYRAAPAAGYWDVEGTVPQFVDTPLQEAFMDALVNGANIIDTLIAELAVPLVVPIIIITFSIAAQFLYNHPDNFLNFAVAVDGHLANCPSSISCENQLCETTAAGNLICSGFFSSCPCEDDCPFYHLMCEETECGGADLTTGGCVGGDNGVNKGCACGIADEGEPYWWGDDLDGWQQGIDGYQTILTGDLWEDDGSGSGDADRDVITCFKQTQAASNFDDSSKWKFVDQSVLDGNIVEFCDSYAGASHSYSFFTGSYNEDNFNSVIIGIAWEGDVVKSADDCKSELRALSADCDWHPTDNQYNWKWGGSFQKGYFTYTINPMINRVAQLSPPDTDWWSEGDSSHWWTTGRSVDPGADRVGMNGANFDMVIVHQCLHDLRRHNWNGGSSWNCADGLINFFGQAQSTYNSWTDCFDNTWQMNSYQFMTNGAIATYGNHRGGSTTVGPTCWMGTYNWSD